MEVEVPQRQRLLRALGGAVQRWRRGASSDPWPLSLLMARVIKGHKDRGPNALHSHGIIQSSKPPASSECVAAC